MDAYGKVTKPFWNDKPVAVIGGGSSLIDFDFEKLRGAHVLAVKGSIFDIPWADAGFGLDYCRDKIVNVQSRIYWAVREDQLANPPQSKNITLLKRLPGQNLSDDPGVIYDGGTSGFGAIQICLHKRAKQIVLFGFDYDGNNGAPSSKWESWAEHFAVYSPYLSQHGIQIVNACPASTIRCFQKVALRDGVAICTKDP